MYKPFIALFLVAVTFCPSVVWCLNDDLDAIEDTIQKHHLEILSCTNLMDKQCVIKQIEAMHKIDQYLRSQLTVHANKALIELIIKQDIENTERLKNILEYYPWITKSEFGEDTENQTWVIVQHSDKDPDFQHRILFILKYLVDHQEAAPQHYAFLYDRLAIKYIDFGMKQRYGTQAKLENGSFVLFDFEGSEIELDTRNVVLTLARIWLTLDTDTIYSKPVSANWAITHLPKDYQLVLKRAHAICMDEEKENWEDLQAFVMPCAHFMFNKINELISIKQTTTESKTIKM